MMNSIHGEHPGDPVAPADIPFPPRKDVVGKYTTLTPASQAHAEDLYANIAGEANVDLWKYLPRPTPADTPATAALIDGWLKSQGTIHFAVLDPKGEVIGTLAYLAIEPEHRRLEIGWVVLGKKLQKTRVATEAFYLAMKYAFELGYHRVEWKANALNEGSVRAAARLGFTYEGTFRKHMISMGKRRDSAWFSILDDEWPAARKGFEAWLDESNFDAEGKQKRGLKELRDSFSNKSTGQ